MENYKYYHINITDIWLCERRYFFSDEQNEYNQHFAIELLDKLEMLITKKSKPNFELSNVVEGNYYYNEYKQYVKSLDSIKGRFELEHFFYNDKCFTYYNNIVVSKKNKDFHFWFTLKLRQYKKNIFEIKNFLDFQLKSNFRNDISKFCYFLKLVIRQYPDLLSKNVNKTTNDWIKYKSSSNHIQLNINSVQDEESNLSKNKNDKNVEIKNENSDKNKIFNVLNENQINKKSNIKNELTSKQNNKQEIEVKNSNFIWLEKDLKLREKQINFLRTQLISLKLIDKISKTVFYNHFIGIVQKNKCINWKGEQYLLIYFIENLKEFMNPSVYVKMSKNVSISTILKHFTWKGKQIIKSNWYKIISVGSNTNDYFYIKIKDIIKDLKQI